MRVEFDREEYRVVLVEPGSRRVRVYVEGGALRLPRIEIPRVARVVSELQTALIRVWGVRVFILDFVPTEPGASPCVLGRLLEVRDAVDFLAVDPDQIPDQELSEQERRLVQVMLEDDPRNPVSRVGWIEEAVAWVESATGLRVCSGADVQQHNAGGGFMLVQFFMEDGYSFWLKATGAPNLHERHVTELLATLYPPSLPHIVATKPEWNAWLMSGEALSLTSLPADAVTVLRLLGGAVKSLAELQIETIGRESLFFAVGAADQRLDVVRDRSHQLFAYVAEAMSYQVSTKVPRIGTARLNEMRQVLERVCGHFDRLGTPSTILHGDMNLGNLVFSEDRCQFIDWCEGYVGHPFVTFQHILLLNPLKDSEGKDWVNEALRGVYRAAMTKVCDPQVVEHSFACMAFFGAVSALYGRGNWPNDVRKDSLQLGYVRTIARQMDRSAREPAFQDALAV